MKKYDIKKVIKSTYLSIRFPFIYSGRIPDKSWELKYRAELILGTWTEYSHGHQAEYYHRFGPDAIDLHGERVQIYTDEVLKRSWVSRDYIMKIAPFRDKFMYNHFIRVSNFLKLFRTLSPCTMLDSMPAGWRKRFGIDFCKELKRAVVKSGGKKYLKDFRIIGIKEKYGVLDVDTTGMTPEVDRVIMKYEYLSQYVCVVCGEDAVKQTVGWVEPYCEKCLPDNSIWIWIDPIYDYTDRKKQKYNEEILKEEP